MGASTYREARQPQRKGRPRNPLFEDLSLLAAFAALWAVSGARVIGALVWHETFGGESTLALMAVIGLPFLVLGWAQSSGKHKDSGDAP